MIHPEDAKQLKEFADDKAEIIINCLENLHGKPLSDTTKKEWREEMLKWLTTATYCRHIEYFDPLLINYN